MLLIVKVVKKRILYKKKQKQKTFYSLDKLRELINQPFYIKCITKMNEYKSLVDLYFLSSFIFLVYFCVFPPHSIVTIFCKAFEDLFLFNFLLCVSYLCVNESTLEICGTRIHWMTNKCTTDVNKGKIT